MARDSRRGRVGGRPGEPWRRRFCGEYRLRAASTPISPRITTPRAMRWNAPTSATRTVVQDGTFPIEQRTGETARDTRAHSIRLDFVSQFGFLQSEQSLPTNILAAVLSPLNCQRSQFEATLANSPPPGWSTVSV